MKLKDGFVKKKMADCYVVVPLEERITDFKGMLTLNEVAAFIVDKLGEDITKEELLNMVQSEYDVDEKTALEDIDGFIKKLEDEDLLER